MPIKTVKHSTMEQVLPRFWTTIIHVVPQFTQSRTVIVTNRRLRLFGHIARSSPREDHHRALAAAIQQVPPDWKQPKGRPSHTWLCAIEADLGPQNYSLATATTRDEWRHIVNTATFQWSTLWKKERRAVVTIERYLQFVVMSCTMW